jgi:hypothetical protein
VWLQDSHGLWPLTSFQYRTGLDKWVVGYFTFYHFDAQGDSFGFVVCRGLKKTPPRAGE